MIEINEKKWVCKLMIPFNGNKKQILKFRTQL